MLAGRSIAAWAGTARQRGTEKLNRVLNYLHRWHYADADILLRVAGVPKRGNLGTIIRWTRQGWLHAVQVDYYPRLVYLLTMNGVREVRAPTPAWYNTRPSEIKHREVRHDLLVQRICLDFETTEVLPARLFRYHLQRHQHERLSRLQQAIDEAENNLEQMQASEYWRAVLAERQRVTARIGRKPGTDYNSVDEARADRALAALETARNAQSEELARQASQVEARQDKAAHWICTPDGLVKTKRGWAAIEVERSRKSKNRHRAVLRSHARSLRLGLYQGVSYYCAGFAGYIQDIATELWRKDTATLQAFNFYNLGETDGR